MKSKEIDEIIWWVEGHIIKDIDATMSNIISNTKYPAILCNEKIITLIRLNKKKRYRCVEEYLNDCGYSEEDIDIFIKKFDMEKERYNYHISNLQEEYIENKEVAKVLNWAEEYLIRLVNNVLSDNINDPEYSAIICNNQIVLLIRLKQEYNGKYQKVEEYLKDKGYSEEDIKKFIESRDKEAKEYGGTIDYLN